MKYIFLALLLSLSFSNQLSAARLSGRVTSSDGEAMPFLTVYLEGTTYGTTTNQNGDYFLELEDGTHQVMFRYVGYQTQKHIVVISGEDKELDVVMKPATQTLKAVVVTSDKEDPAYAIIREAQAKRTFYKNQVKGYSCKVYIKNVQRIDEFEAPRLLSSNSDIKEFEAELERNKVVYFSESLSKYYFLAPNKEKEVIISSKVSGDSRGFSWNSARYLDFDLYQNLIEAPIGERKFVSPIASGAMSYYDYQYEGESLDRGIKVHKIRIFPRSEGQPLFGGLLYIQDSTWRIHSTDLIIDKKSGIEFINELNIKQVFIPANSQADVWLCGTQSFLFDYKVNMMGFKVLGRGTYVGTFSSYDVTPNFTRQQLQKDVGASNIKIKKRKRKKPKLILPSNTGKETGKKLVEVKEKDTIAKRELIALEDDFFNSEITIVTDSSNQKTEDYWKTIRPVPLTDEESKRYSRSDSIEKAHQEPAYLDSVDREYNKFKPLDILFGYSYRNRKKELTFYFNPLTENIQFNTVEGFVLNGGVSLSKRREKDLSFTRIGADARYGFSSNRFYAKGNFLHRFNQVNGAYFYAAGGAFVEQFDSDAISPFVNGIYTTLREENYLKIFEKRYGQIGFGRRIANGLVAQLQVGLEERVPLQNADPFPRPYIDRDDVSFTPNLPVNAEGESVFFERHQATLLKGRLTYRIGEKYISRPKQKIRVSSGLPVLTLTYTQALPDIANSQADFAQILFNIKDDMNLGVVGTTNYEAQAGGFLWNNYTSFADYFHFTTSPILLTKSRLRQFLLLPFYEYSTTDGFVELHAEHHFNGYIMNRIPLIKKLKWQLVGGVHYLHTPNAEHYTEVSLGFERIFKIIRIDGVWNANNQFGQEWGVRLRLGM